MDEKDFKKIMIPVAVLILAVLSFIIVKPIAVPIFTGLLLAYIFYPVYKKINLRIKSENLSASIIIMAFLAIVLIPLLLLMPIFVQQLFNVYIEIKNADISGLILQIIPSLASQQQMTTEIIAATSQFSSQLSNWILSVFQNTIINLPEIIFSAVILMFTFFFGLREGYNVREYLFTLFPFPKEYRQKFYMRFDEVTNSVIYGHIVIGIAQGVVAGIGYFLFGVPNAILFTVLTTLVGVIPVVGPWLVWIPVDLFLFINGNSAAGLELLIFGLFVISWVDTILRPSVVAKQAQMNSAIALIGAIGGIYAFGWIGFMAGPLVLATLILLIEIYKDKDAKSIVLTETKEVQASAEASKT